MSKAVLISIQPKWCKLIADGEKTIEVRKIRPKLDTPFKCYIYCTKGNPKDPHELLEIHSSDGKIRKTNGMVMGEFVCDNIRCFDVPYPAFQKKMDKSTLEQSCLTYWQLHRFGINRAPQSWCYVEELTGGRRGQ